LPGQKKAQVSFPVTRQITRTIAAYAASFRLAGLSSYAAAFSRSLGADGFKALDRVT
jgi:hypothetical protein